MSNKSKIEWTDATWNPTRGCVEVSEGCKHCYAKTFAERWRGTPGHAYEQGFDLRLVPEKLDEPFGWKRPRRVFVNSMSDLFHGEIPLDFVKLVFSTMNRCPQHTFQILTKRAARLSRVARELPWTPNIWIGVSVENQTWAQRRIPLLLTVKAQVRFLSCEPLLGPLELKAWLPGIDWVICGGESGPGARPMEMHWAESLQLQCWEDEVPFFMKQLGGVRDKRSDMSQFPADLQVREFPNTTE